MRWMKSRFCLLLTVMIGIFFPVLCANGAEQDKNVKLELVYQDPETQMSLKDVKAELYLVGTIDAAGEVKLSETFASYPVRLQGNSIEDWNQAALALEGYILRDEILPADQGKTDQNGRVVFPNEKGELEEGIYLVIGHPHVQGDRNYRSQAFFVMLPYRDMVSNQWIYQTSANPKLYPEDVVKKTECNVIKIWKDEGFEQERPEEIQVQLLKDGEVYDSVYLNQDNNWQYSWTELDGKHRWSVIETEVEQYELELVLEKDYYILTNHYIETPKDIPDEEPKLPQTGQLWWPVPILIALSLLFFLLGMLRRKKF